MKLTTASCGVSSAQLRQSPTCLCSYELRCGHLAILLCSQLQSIPPKVGKPGEGEGKWRHDGFASFRL